MPNPVLSADQKAQLSRDGFVTIANIVEAGELETLRSIFDRLFATKAGWSEGNQFDLAGTDQGDAPKLPQILKPSRYAPELLELSPVRRARAITRDYFETDADPIMGEHMIFKPPRVGSTTPWHQDQAYHDPTLDERGLNFWIPLDDTDEANGCMQYVPGSHRMDVLPHHSIGNDPRVHGLEVDGPERFADQVVACPLSAGDAVLHLPTTLHYAGPNRTDRQRRAYIVSMVAPSAQRAVPVDNYWMREKRTARLERAQAAEN
ncbi:MAG: phytanoyl-CoA dioxygenase family protein [Rhodobacter sp.]|nr:phytanoyl-CoA dioxygenase family protein [Rhodobacter sp.]